MDATYRIQSNSGTVDPAATSFTATLPNATQDSSTLMLWIGMNTGTVNLPAVDPPWYVDVSASSKLWVMRRDNQPSGESSWTLSSAFSVRWAWYVEEWASWSTINQPDATASQIISHVGTQANSVSPVGTAPSADIPDFAGLAVFNATGGAGVGIFPARSYSAGWSEVNVTTIGTGTAGTDHQLIVAETYPGVTGSIDCTLTWDTSNGGTYTDKRVDTWSACYRPSVPVSFGVLTA